MKLYALSLIAASLLFCNLANGQKIKVKEGNADVLKGEKAVNIEFTYNNLSVGKFKNEEEYIAKKREEYNKKEEGKGDKWAEAWINDRDRAYQPQFLEQFLEKSGVKNEKDAKYTLIFHTTFIEPGFNVGAWRKSASINAVVTIVETADRNKVAAVITIDNAPGRDAMGYDFDTSWRISEAYAKAGKSLAKFMW
ncbi:MAG TPA: hypothetical protein PKE30_02250 [Niabella sp.]|nr:hypothetical protein [Niabella sp.]